MKRVREFGRLSVLALLTALGFVGGAAMAADLNVEVRDLSGKPLTDAVVFVTQVSGSTHRPAQTPRTSIDQVNREFKPLVSVVETGTEISFPNSDNVRHSIYSFSPAKRFTAKLYSGKQAVPVIFDKSGLVVLGCNIHDSMVAWVVVVDTPYFAKTGAGGAAVIKGLKSGDYLLNVWYPQPKFDPHVEPIHFADADQQREVKLDSAGSPLPGVNARVQQGQ
jgi:plastocyanin